MQTIRRGSKCRTGLGEFYSTTFIGSCVSIHRSGVRTRQIRHNSQWAEKESRILFLSERVEVDELRMRWSRHRRAVSPSTVEPARANTSKINDTIAGRPAGRRRRKALRQNSDGKVKENRTRRLSSGKAKQLVDRSMEQRKKRTEEESKEGRPAGRPAGSDAGPFSFPFIDVSTRVTQLTWRSSFFVSTLHSLHSVRISFSLTFFSSSWRGTVWLQNYGSLIRAK